MSPFDASYSFEDIVKYGIALVVFFSMLLAIVYTIYGGFLMVLSGGDEGKVKWAVNHIRYAVLGIVILLIVLFISPIFFQLFWLPYGDYFSPAVIWDTIHEISAYIFGSSSSSPYSGSINSLTPTDSGFTDL